MAKFSSAPARANVSHPIATTGAGVSTHQGGVGYEPDAKSELFKLAVTNFVKEATFYESGESRDDRFERLIHQVTVEDPEWMRRMIPWLRNDANMRSASLVAAAEYVKAGGKGGRGVVSAALQRADEPGEMLAYWHQRHGRRVPKPVKRGVADAARRLYTERAALKWDGQAKPWRFADVVELVRPVPTAEWQSALFKYAIDKRHGRDVTAGDMLPTLSADSSLLSMPAEIRREQAKGPIFQQAGWNWERLSGWLPGGMDAEAWEFVIPNMGYMALLRNLRNFDQAGISTDAVKLVQAKLTSPEEVAKSRQFPMRFLSAYKAVESERWKPALEEAVNLSMANVPSLPGKTLVLVDVSYSMVDKFSDKGTLERWEAASVFGAALATRCEQADLFAYSSEGHNPGYGWTGNGFGYVANRGGSTRKTRIEFGRGASVFTLMDRIKTSPSFGGGTETWMAVSETFAGHDRVVLLTDEQVSYGGGTDPGVGVLPLVYTFNLAGYMPGHARSGDRGRYAFGGLSDQAFSAIPMLEQFQAGTWPF